MCKNIPGISPKKIRKISHPDLEISLYLSNFSKEVSQLTDWQTYKKFKIKCINYKNIPGKPPKMFRKIYHPVLEIYLYWPNFSMRVGKLTDWQTYKKFQTILNYCKNTQGMSPKNVRNTSLPELEIFLHLSNYSKERSQLTHWQTYKKFQTIWNLCTNTQ